MMNETTSIPTRHPMRLGLALERTCRIAGVKSMPFAETFLPAPKDQVRWWPQYQHPMVSGLFTNRAGFIGDARPNSTLETR